MIRFAHPAYLAIGLVLCLPYVLRPQRAWHYSSVHLLPAKSRRGFTALSTAAMTLVALTLLLVALLRPQTTVPQVDQPLQARDIILTLDLSLSMEGHMPAQQVGTRHERKLDLVKRTAIDFVQRHVEDRLGLIVFGDEAFGVWPLSSDSTTMLRRLDQLETLLPAQLRGTHVEKALLKSLQHMQELGQSANKIILLLTDGLDTIEPSKAEQILQRLQRQKISLYVLGMQLNDNSSVVRLAQRAQGGYYAIDKAEEMHRALAEIEQLEKTRLSAAAEVEFEDVYGYFALPGLLLLFLATVCRSVWVLEV
jgi:Ca-activated chloride channel family protein